MQGEGKLHMKPVFCEENNLNKAAGYFTTQLFATSFCDC